MNITKITIGRLYNLGNYEHVRYDLTVEVKEGESAATAITGMEAIIAGLAPLSKACIKSAGELQRMAAEVEQMKTMPVVDWERRYVPCSAMQWVELDHEAGPQTAIEAWSDGDIKNHEGRPMNPWIVAIQKEIQRRDFRNLREFMKWYMVMNHARWLRKRSAWYDDFGE